MYQEIRKASRLSEQRRVIIDEVNTGQYFIVGRDSQGSNIRINFDLQDPMVSIPAPREMWSIKRAGTGEWILDKKLETGAEIHSIDTLNPGDRRIETTGTIYLSGQDVSINGTTFGELLTLIGEGGNNSEAVIRLNEIQDRSDVYTVTNVTTDRVLDANSYTPEEAADVLGTLIQDLQDRGIIGGGAAAASGIVARLNQIQDTSDVYTITNVSTDRSYNADLYTWDEIVDVLGTLIQDLKDRGIIG